MADSTITKRALEVIAPVAGQITVVAITGSAQLLDLSTTGPLTGNLGSSDAIPGDANTMGGVGRYVEIYADSVDIGVLFGSTSGAVSTSNAPSLTQTGTNTAGCCLRIPSGTSRSFLIHKPTQFLGYIGSSATGYIRIAVTSRA